MTGPTEFSHEDSSAVVAAPLFAAMAVISAGAPRGAVREIEEGVGGRIGRLP
jgi:hypothetical protein